MGKLTENNLITIDTPLKTGQRCLRIGNRIIPVGVGGMYEPSGGSSGSSMDFYKCSYVNSDSWGGYKAVLSNGIYNF